MPQNSDPKNRMTQDAMVVNRKRPKKNSWKFVRPKKIAEILRNPEK